MIIESHFINAYPCLLVASDEAGRGPLAGPVVASSAAVLVESADQLKKTVKLLRKSGVNDSKKLSVSTREELQKLKGNWKISTVEISAEEIDEIEDAERTFGSTPKFKTPPKMPEKKSPVEEDAEEEDALSYFEKLAKED
jgi:ribonuclease HII